MGLFRNFISQTRKPEGMLGRLMVNGMNGGHARLADWGMALLDGIPAADIADLGCGGGRNASELLRRYPASKLTAMDYSEVSVAKAREVNKAAVASGRCGVVQGDVSSLPFPDEAFDLATAFETVYFWPGPEKSFAEVCRVLRPGGAFLICNESDGADEVSLKYEKLIEGMRCYTARQLDASMKEAGFTRIRPVHHPSKPWLAVLAIK